jgi:colanic acid/amylovoran biosynthesis glycosyltransferase
MPPEPVIVTYRDHLLPLSETFIRAQAEALQSFVPYYVGSRLVPGLSLPPERTLVINHWGSRGKIREIPFKSLGIAPRLVRAIRKLEPVLIHAHFGSGGTTVLPVARRLQLPLLVTFHGQDASVKDKFARRSFYAHRVYLLRRDALKREACLFIAVSRFIREKLLEQGFPSNKVLVHYIGVDTEAFRPDLSAKPERAVLFVGRLVEKKGVKFLIRAMAQVQRAIDDVELVLIGDGPLRSELEETATQLPGPYRFLGHQPASVVRSWMTRALLLCAPSVTASTGATEGLPIVVVEAQASGLPVVGTYHAGTPEAVIHGETGFLAPERDWEKLATYIARLIEDESLRRQFSQKARKRAVAELNLFRQTRALEDIYKTVLRGDI